MVAFEYICVDQSETVYVHYMPGGTCKLLAAQKLISCQGTQLTFFQLSTTRVSSEEKKEV